MKPTIRLLSLILILAIVPAMVLWVGYREMSFLWWLVPGAVAFSAMLLGLWYLVFGKAAIRSRLRRVALVAAGFLLLAFAASRLIRYEGSSSGSSYPVFAWAWEEKRQEPPSPPSSEMPPESSLTAIPPEALGDLENFLGPNRNGIREAPAFGTDWTADPPRILWRRVIGKGWSSFTVSRGRALTQQQIGDDEHVTCLDIATGRDLWSHSDPGVRLLLERAENSGATMGGDGPRATPTIHDGRVYTMGATGIVNCLDLATGEKIWSRPLLRELGGIAHRWGMANSPLVLSNPPLVVFAGPDAPGPTLVACDPATGETRWTYDGGGASYSSPILATLAGTEQIVSVNYIDVCGLDPATGIELWSHPWPGTFPKVGQPMILDGDRILVTSSYGMASLLLSVTRDPSGGFAADQQWRSTYLKTKFSSAAVLGGYAYGLDEGRLACIDLSSGKRVWKNEKFGFGQHLLFGKWLLVQTETGDVVIGTVDPEGFTETGRIPALSSMTWNAPALAGRVLLVRNDREAAAWLLPEPAAGTSKK